ncbi:hypothetical protein FHS07_001249 [Microbacterium proteolyticum]|uniref:Uncharacterized protein n=1 Tax=Microbacterium proteolyticum TaxID=1572644 RepID=A0A7W5CH56_9MICO|nr:hypothetical protein [Microbacterium proteolyticum]
MWLRWQEAPTVADLVDSLGFGGETMLPRVTAAERGHAVWAFV